MTKEMTVLTRLILRQFSIMCSTVHYSQAVAELRQKEIEALSKTQTTVITTNE